MYVSICICTRIAFPNYEVVGFQPQTEDIPDLDLGCQITGMTEKNWAMIFFFGTSILMVKNNPSIMVIYCENFAFKIDK